MLASRIPNQSSSFPIGVPQVPEMPPEASDSGSGGFRPPGDPWLRSSPWRTAGVASGNRPGIGYDGMIAESVVDWPGAWRVEYDRGGPVGKEGWR